MMQGQPQHATARRLRPTFDLSGRVALVTGASSGIGERCARILAAAGASVVLAARRTDRLQATRRQIEADGGRAICLAMDVAEEASTIAAFDAAEDAFGVVDSIVANAGTTAKGSTFDLPIADFDRVFAVNVRGVYLTAREGARRMIQARRSDGRILLVSSIAAVSGFGSVPYAASKAAVMRMGRAMAREWAPQGINVNVLLPGYIRTELTDEWLSSDGGARQVARFPRRRLLDIEALDEMLLYLTSDASAMTTGACVTLDDGQTL
jgi:NAD(P)-dependent dehydrogenase (short-subunit alcohol dehydrogenase family)